MKGATVNGTTQASVSIAGTTYDLPVRKGTLGPGVVDISTLYEDIGRFTYDPGFASTASCESKITFIDFDKGAMRRIFILHADHEQSASTSTVRLAGSSGANPYACISAGIACLWGPVHGGATRRYC